MKEKLKAMAEKVGGSAGVSLMAAYNLMLTVSATTAEAQTSDLVTKIKAMAGQIYSFIVGISTVTAAIVVAYCLLTMLLNKDERKVASSMEWLKRAIVCWIAIFLVSSIFNWLMSSMNLSSGTTLNIPG